MRRPAERLNLVPYVRAFLCCYATPPHREMAMRDAEFSEEGGRGSADTYMHAWAR
jgi:hypothetical protein